MGLHPRDGLMPVADMPNRFVIGHAEGHADQLEGTLAEAGPLGRSAAGPPMFILYAIPIGIVAGYLLGGRLDRLGDLRFHWAWLAIAGLVVQVVLFSPTGRDDRRRGRAGPLRRVHPGRPRGGAPQLADPGTRGRRHRGGAATCSRSSPTAGSCRRRPEAVAALGWGAAEGFSNSVVWPTRRSARSPTSSRCPTWMPAANVFSIGDVLIGIGVVLVIALGMRGGAAARTEA